MPTTRKLGAFAVLLVAVGCNLETRPDPILIGHPVALSGANKESGEEIRRGVELAFAETKEIGGRRVKLVIEDTESNPDRARAQATQLVFAHKVSAILSGDPGTGDERVAAICRNASPPVPMISVAGSLKEGGSLVFCTGLSTEARRRALADFAAKELPGKEIAFLEEPSALSEVLKKDRPTALLCTLEPEPALRGEAKALEGCYFCTTFHADDPTPSVQEFVQKYKARHGQPPGPPAALGYDSGRLVLEALRRAGGDEAESVREHLAGSASFPGVSGPISLRPGTVKRPAVIVRWEQGKLEFVKNMRAAD